MAPPRSRGRGRRCPRLPCPCRAPRECRCSRLPNYGPAHTRPGPPPPPSNLPLSNPKNPTFLPSTSRHPPQLPTHPQKPYSPPPRHSHPTFDHPPLHRSAPLATIPHLHSSHPLLFRGPAGSAPLCPTRMRSYLLHRRALSLRSVSDDDHNQATAPCRQLPPVSCRILL